MEKRRRGEEEKRRRGRSGEVEKRSLPWYPFGLPRVPSHGVPPHPIPVRFAPHPADRPRVASRFKLEKTLSFISHSCILMRIHGIGPYAIPGPFPHCITTPPLNQTLFVFYLCLGLRWDHVVATISFLDLLSMQEKKRNDNDGEEHVSLQSISCPHPIQHSS